MICSIVERIKPVLKKAGLYPAVFFFLRLFRLILKSDFRQSEAVYRREFKEFKKKYTSAIGRRFIAAGGRCPKALIHTIGFPSGVPAELVLIKGFELAGYEPVVVCHRDPWLIKYYRAAHVDEILFWDQFTKPLDFGSAGKILKQCASIKDLLKYESQGARAGRFSASTSLRALRVGRLDLEREMVRQHLIHSLAFAESYSSAARDIVHRVQPQLGLFVDRGYSPQGELFDQCIKQGVRVVTWNAAHRNSTLMLKRYTIENRDEHPSSLSPESWRFVQTMSWAKSHRKKLYDELYNAYAQGEWYGEVGTQANKRILNREEIAQKVGLDPAKKTAVIFPHILWDATFFWGEDLFENYEEWLVETVKAACRNPKVNWVIKIHPANLVKDKREGVTGEPSESVAIKKFIGKLPPHVFVIPADSEINTFSLFSVMDYCLTVRGTIGIEAAAFGIPVLTAGTGRYDRRGFTIDSQSRSEFLQRLDGIEKVSPLSAEQRNLAERYAYGVLILRPLVLKSLTMEYQKDAKASLKTAINIHRKEDWFDAEDLKIFCKWLSHSRDFDFMMPT